VSAHVVILAPPGNMTELVLLSAHPSPQPKRQIDRFSHFYTAHGRKSLYFTMGGPFPQYFPFSWGSEPHLTHDFLGHSEPTIQTASNRFRRFRTGDRRVSLYFTMVFYNGTPLSPQNCPFEYVGIWTPSNT